jgi:hypothetical protein
VNPRAWDSGTVGPGRLASDEPAQPAAHGTPFAVEGLMSKQNNVNPGQYYDGDRNHHGEGILHEDHRDRMGQDRAAQEGRQGEPNFIPGEAPAGEPGKSSGKKDEE